MKPVALPESNSASWEKVAEITESIFGDSLLIQSRLDEIIADFKMPSPLHEENVNGTMLVLVDPRVRSTESVVREFQALDADAEFVVMPLHQSVDDFFCQDFSEANIGFVHIVCSSVDNGDENNLWRIGATNGTKTQIYDHCSSMLATNRTLSVEELKVSRPAEVDSKESRFDSKQNALRSHLELNQLEKSASELEEIESNDVEKLQQRQKIDAKVQQQLKKYTICKDGSHRVTFEITLSNTGNTALAKPLIVFTFGNELKSIISKVEIPRLVKTTADQVPTPNREFEADFQLIKDDGVIAPGQQIAMHVELLLDPKPQTISLKCLVSGGGFSDGDSVIDCYDQKADENCFVKAIHFDQSLLPSFRFGGPDGKRATYEIATGDQTRERTIFVGEGGTWSAPILRRANDGLEVTFASSETNDAEVSSAPTKEVDPKLLRNKVNELKADNQRIQNWLESTAEYLTGELSAQKS